MSKHETKNILKELKNIQPNDAWKQETRAFLLKEIQNTHSLQTTKQSTPFMQTLLQNWKYVLQPVGTFVLTVALIGGSVATVRASRGSLPGDVLYPIKRNVENVTISFTFDRREKIRKKVELVGKRIEELNEIANKDIEAPQKTEKIQKAVDEIKKDSSKVDEQLQEILDVSSLEGEDEAGTKGVIDEVKNLAAQGDEYEKTLAGISEQLPEAVKTDGQKIVKEALSKIEETNVKAVVVIVKEHKSGKTNLEDDEVDQLVGKALDKAQQKLLTSKEKLSEVKKVEATQGASEQGSESDESSNNADSDQKDEQQPQTDEEKNATATQQTDTSKKENEGGVATEPVEKPVDTEQLIQETSKKLDDADDLLDQKDYDNVLTILQESKQVLQVVETEVAKAEEVVYNNQQSDEGESKDTNGDKSQENPEDSSNNENDDTSAANESDTQPETIENTSQ